jgi:hypothetical protein
MKTERLERTSSPPSLSKRAHIRLVSRRSGVPIPEMSRDDDDFEDFEKLIDAGLQGRDLPAIERPVNQKQGPPNKRKSTFSKIVDDGDGERSMDLTGNDAAGDPDII